MNTLLGRKPLLEMLSHEPKRVKAIYIAESADLDRDLVDLIDTCNAKTIRTSTDAIEELSDGQRCQGVVAMIEAKAPITLDKAIQLCTAENRIILCLDEISDPHNLGAIFRAAESVGVCAVLKTDKRSANENSATVSKTSAGANAFVNVVKVSNLATALKKIAKSGIWIYGAALEDSSTDLFTSQVLSPCALVVGSEGKGLRKQTISLCDGLLHIPMNGKIQSLNVSQATTVFLYEIIRKKAAENSDNG